MTARAECRLTLLSRAGCHLCDRARAVVAAVATESNVAWEEIDVDTDQELRAEYGDLVPVLLVDGEEHGFFEMDPMRVRAALA